MEKAELKNMDAAMLANEVASLKKEIFDLRLSTLSGQVKDVSQFKKLKKRIAQALTVLNQKKAKAGQPKELSKKKRQVTA